MKSTMFTEYSESGIKRLIDEFLAERKPHKPVPLILTADGHSRRYDYRGIAVREWHCGGNVRFDAAVELEDAK